MGTTAARLLLGAALVGGAAGAAAAGPAACRTRVAPAPRRAAARRSAPAAAAGGAAPPEAVAVDESALEAWGVRPAVLDAAEDEFAARARAINADPPAFAIDDFLSAAECDQIIALAKAQREAGAPESDLYLNYRVNQEVGGAGAGAEGAALSSEAAALIDEAGLDEAQLSAAAPSGFRLQVDALASALDGARADGDGAAGGGGVEAALGARVLRLLGLPHKRLRFAEGIWVKPDRLYAVIRDVTVVHYREGEGVAPHVDGKDATLLCYLNDVAEGCGGRTVFPEDGFASTPARGRALLYWSKQRLLHYSEALKPGAGDKWVMQLLIDVRHADTGTGPYVDFATGQVVHGV